MIRKIYNKYFQSSPILQKVKVMRRRIRAAYRVLIGYKVNEYERDFESQVGAYDINPDDLNNARKHGIYPSSYVVYNLDKWNIDQYFAERDLYELDLRNRGIAPYLVDKRNLPLLFQNNSHYIPSLNIAIEKSKIQYIIEDGVYQEGDYDLEDLIKSYLKKYAKLIVKPNNLSYGEGIFTISNRLTEEDLQRIQNEGNAIINNVLINEEYAYRINPSSLNTIRVVFFKAKNGSLRAFRMFHRFGASSESFVDNTSAGGVAAIIDQETGELQQAYTVHRKRVDLNIHPATGQAITGLKIPDWSSKKRDIDELLQEMNYLEYGGLDIAFTTEGLKIIEINTRFPALRAMQFSSPALIDEEFVEFLKLRGFDRLSQKTYLQV
ncbi:MAG: hypothetical protein LHW44_01430 [Candidatus Cloacimonetes bacterium]|nr:hypothetical protein [Candidatus Cloacimonadota bacterium]